MVTMVRLTGKRFPLGRLVWTAGVNAAIADNATFAAFVLRCLKRHASGDWGDMDGEDKAENEFSVAKPLRIFSAYNTPEGAPGPDQKVWIITEADRSVTTVLWPSEY